MLLCFYAHPVRSGVVCEGLSEKGDRQVLYGMENEKTMPSAYRVSCVGPMSARVSGGLYAALSLVGVV